MILKQIKSTLVKLSKIEGINHNKNEPYCFYKAKILDEDGNLFIWNLDTESEDQKKELDKHYVDKVNLPITLDIKLYHSLKSGMGCKILAINQGGL
jgi:hypothetical protein